MKSNENKLKIEKKIEKKKTKNKNKTTNVSKYRTKNGDRQQIRGYLHSLVETKARDDPDLVVK